MNPKSRMFGSKHDIVQPIFWLDFCGYSFQWIAEIFWLIHSYGDVLSVFARKIEFYCILFMRRDWLEVNSLRKTWKSNSLLSVIVLKVEYAGNTYNNVGIA